jgi:hypothetical protein
MSNVRPPNTRRAMLNQGPSESERLEQTRRRSVSRQIHGLRQPPANGLSGTQGKCSGGRESVRVQFVVEYWRSKQKSNVAVALVPTLMKFRHVRPGRRTYRQARKSLEGTTHARPARPIQLRVAAFVRVTHTVAHTNARGESNGYGAVSMHARPDSHAPQPEV